MFCRYFAGNQFWRVNAPWHLKCLGVTSSWQSKGLSAQCQPPGNAALLMPYLGIMIKEMTGSRILWCYLICRFAATIQDTYYLQNLWTQISVAIPISDNFAIIPESTCFRTFWGNIPLLFTTILGGFRTGRDHLDPGVQFSSKLNWWQRKKQVEGTL